MPIATIALVLAGLASWAFASGSAHEQQQPRVQRVDVDLNCQPAAVEAAESVPSPRSGQRYGVAVLDRATGQVAVGDLGAAPFYSASVVKLLTVVDILHRVHLGTHSLTDEQAERIRRALSRSDDQAMNRLWVAAGGPASVARAVELMGLRDTRPPADPSQWGETVISARDVLTVYDHVLTEMPAVARDLIMNALASARPVGADGFDQSFGLLSRPAVAPRRADGTAKQGWMIYESSIYLHTTGTLGPERRYVIAMLTEQPASVGYEQASAELTRATTRLIGALAPCR